MMLRQSLLLWATVVLSVYGFAPSHVVRSTGRYPSTPLRVASSSQELDAEYAMALQSWNAGGANETTKSWQDDGFIFGLEGSGLQRPVGKVPVLVVQGDSLETQPYQVAIVSLTLLHHAFYLVTSMQELLLQNNQHLLLTILQCIVLTVTSWIAADFGSGVLHWSVDNYGNGRTPIMGTIIAAFQGHHTAPWTIAQRGFCNNVYKLCVPFGIIPVSLIAYLAGPMTTYWMTLFCILEILSQEFHKWSHQLKSDVPRIAAVLQDAGLSIGRVPHAQHHLAPFEGNYCIISGVCNPILDQTGFFRRLEHFIFNWNGVESNAWKLDPILRQRTLQGDYRLPSSVNERI
jgi:palmitoyl-[glycerolipid] 3-(E)-desaturase